MPWKDNLLSSGPSSGEPLKDEEIHKRREGRFELEAPAMTSKVFLLGDDCP